MANVCEFEMVLRGNKENIERFVTALTQKGNVWMGRGAYLYGCAYGKRSAHITGEVKWSLQSSLIDGAVSMQSEPERWGDLPKNGEFLTIFEACKKYFVNMEVYSKEPGCQFQEHLMYENGAELNDTVSYEEVWDTDTGEILETIGGYPSWNFTVADAR